MEVTRRCMHSQNKKNASQRRAFVFFVVIDPISPPHLVGVLQAGLANRFEGLGVAARLEDVVEFLLQARRVP